jgi:hypothetical protein
MTLHGHAHSLANEIFQLTRALQVAQENGRAFEAGAVVGKIYPLLDEYAGILAQLDPQAVEGFKDRLKSPVADATPPVAPAYATGVAPTDRRKRK